MADAHQGSKAPLGAATDTGRATIMASSQAFATPQVGAQPQTTPKAPRSGEPPGDDGNSCEPFGAGTTGAEPLARTVNSDLVGPIGPPAAESPFETEAPADQALSSAFDEVAIADHRALTHDIGPDAPNRKAQAGKPSLALYLGWFVLLSVTATLLVFLWREPRKVVARFPGMAPVYAALGMPVDPVGLTFRDVSYRWVATNGPPTLRVEGRIENVVDRAVPVPTLVFVLLDDKGRVVFKWAKRVRLAGLPPGESTRFRALVPAPVGLVSGLRLEFAPGTEPARRL